MGGNKDKDGQNKQDQFKHGDYDEKPSILSWKDHRGILFYYYYYYYYYLLLLLLLLFIIYYGKGDK